MSFKPFYIHGQRLPMKKDKSKQRSLPRAFTAYISPSLDNNKANVQVTFCSYKDQFVKKLGREKVHTKPVYEVEKKEVGFHLDTFWDKLYLRPFYDQSMFNYVIKYLE